MATGQMILDALAFLDGEDRLVIVGRGFQAQFVQQGQKVISCGRHFFSSVFPDTQAIPGFWSHLARIA